MPPPKLPSEILRRLLKVARFNGMSVIILAGLFTLVSAAELDVSGTIWGALITAGGAVEVRGVSLLKAHRPGLQWLIGSQLYLLIVILSYVCVRILNLAKDPMLAEVTSSFKQAGLDMDQMPIDLQQLARTSYLAVAALTVLYQGGMALYYFRRRASVELAIQSDGPAQA
jgi:hypothetical protein